MFGAGLQRQNMDQSVQLYVLFLLIASTGSYDQEITGSDRQLLPNSLL